MQFFSFFFLTWCKSKLFQEPYQKAFPKLPAEQTWETQEPHRRQLPPTSQTAEVLLSSGIHHYAVFKGWLKHFKSIRVTPGFSRGDLPRGIEVVVCMPSFHLKPGAVCCNLQTLHAHLPPSHALHPSSAHRVWSLTVLMKAVKINQSILCRISRLYVIFVNFGCDSGYYQIRSCERQVKMFSAAASARSQPTSWCHLNASLIEHSKAEGLRHILCPSFHHSWPNNTQRELICLWNARFCNHGNSKCVSLPPSQGN